MQGLILNGFSLEKSPYSEVLFFFPLGFFFLTLLSPGVQYSKRREDIKQEQANQSSIVLNTKHVHYELVQTTYFFNRLEDQFPAGGKHWSCKENVDITTETSDSCLFQQAKAFLYFSDCSNFSSQGSKKTG